MYANISMNLELVGLVFQLLILAVVLCGVGYFVRNALNHVAASRLQRKMAQEASLARTRAKAAARANARALASARDQEIF